MRNKRQALKRVQEIANAAFAKRGFEKVSVGELAASAHCSTATIYAAYGSKSGLYFELRREKAARVHIPMPAKASGAKSLQSLLTYARDRIQSLSDIRDIQNYYALPARIDHKRMRSITRNLIRRANPLPSLTATVKQAMSARLLRRTNAEDVAYIIWTAVGWEAAMLHLLFDSELVVDPAPIIRKVFTPLVTPSGHGELSQFLSSQSKAPSPARRAPVASLLRPDLLP